MNRSKIGLAVVASVVLGAAIVFSMRDGGDAQTSPDQEFVDSLCAAAVPRIREMYELMDDVIHTRAAPGYEDGWFPLYSFGWRARNEALLYRKDVRAVVPPATPAGVKAAKYLPFIAKQPLGPAAHMQSWIRALPRKLSLIQSIKSLNRIQDELVFAFTAMNGGEPLFAAVEPELLDEFDKAESCKKLDAVSARPPRT